MKITDLIPDAKNANRGTKRGNKAVAESLSRFGAGRSIVIDKAGRIIAGNKTAANAAAAGIEDVILVPSDGTRIIAVQRIDLDLDDPKAKGLAIADNRAAELGLEWDPDVLREMADAVDLAPFFTAAELESLKVITLDAEPAPDQSDTLTSGYSVLIECDNEAAQLSILERLTAEGFSCRSLIA